MELIKQLPNEIITLIEDFHLNRVTIGQSGAEVFHLTSANKPSLYLKISTISPFLDLEIESRVLDWLKNRLPIPQQQLYITDKNREYLLITEIPGINIADAVSKYDTELLVRLLAKGLKTIHSAPITHCPFFHTIDIEIEIVKNRIAHNLVDESSFDDERQGRKPIDLFDELMKNRPVSQELVFTHGDYCLPNRHYLKLKMDDNLNGFLR
ncbi:MAG: aminoglycoside 3'-phosphotransferase [Acidobacteriota bacterium]